eukprot:CAMPEP_0172182108 /NCGR_PEP_ID=MMETSP1050-20130122/18208_2 /TAXON_ID=233186 /ORGANISM="Cryptomonas curvata, Strain CCAP979/52" /LENGTH=91 /DNA_ID=CAMNT_0012855501 /DNA_START=401 /DNA_END=676 /DNA_ORIENTATION=-
MNPMATCTDVSGDIHAPRSLKSLSQESEVATFITKVGNGYPNSSSSTPSPIGLLIGPMIHSASLMQLPTIIRFDDPCISNLVVEFTAATIR